MTPLGFSSTPAGNFWTVGKGLQFFGSQGISN